MGDTNVHIKAKDVEIGDNVWGANIVVSKEVCRHIQTDAKYLLFNGATITPWISDGNDEVMVTNR